MINCIQWQVKVNLIKMDLWRPNANPRHLNHWDFKSKTRRMHVAKLQLKMFFCNSITNQTPFSCDESRMQLLQASHKNSRNEKEISDCEPSCCQEIQSISRHSFIQLFTTTKRWPKCFTIKSRKEGAQGRKQYSNIQRIQKSHTKVHERQE